MKRIGIAIVICALLSAVSGFAKDIYLPFQLKESIKKNASQLKTGVVGSYPRHTEEFNWVTDWVLFRTIETSYTSFGEPAVIEYNQDGNRTMDLYSYNDQHDVTEVKTQAMVGGTWVNQSRQLTSYNAQGLEQEFRNEQWNGTGWDLMGGNQITYEMDGDRIKVYISKSWNAGTSAWENSSRETYTYTGAGIQYASSIMDMWDNAWVPSIKNEYTWTSNRVSEWLSYSYENSAWTLSSKTIFDYQNNNSFVMTMFTYLDPDQWMETSRITVNYDSHGNATLNQIEMFMGAWTVFTATKYALTYTGNNLSQRITQTYSMFPPVEQGTTGTITWKNVLKEVFSNFASLGTDITLLPDTGLSVFPNPSGKQAMVRMAMLKAGQVTLSLYSMTGQRIVEEVITASGSDINYPLNLNGIRPGSYILIARDKQGVEIGKTRLIKDKE